jgi:hypothetical protein
LVVLSANETLCLVIARGHAKFTSPIMKGVIYMLDLDLFYALETMSLMDDYEFEKIRLEFEKNGYILKRDKNENGDTDITVEKK